MCLFFATRIAEAALPILTIFYHIHACVVLTTFLPPRMNRSTIVLKKPAVQLPRWVRKLFVQEFRLKGADCCRGQHLFPSVLSHRNDVFLRHLPVIGRRPTVPLECQAAASRADPNVNRPHSHQRVL